MEQNLFRSFRVGPVFLSLGVCWLFSPSWPSVYTWDTDTYLLQNKLPEQVICVPESNSKAAHAPTPHRDTRSNRTRHKLQSQMPPTLRHHELNSGVDGRQHCEAKKKRSGRERRFSTRREKKRFRGAPRLHATCQIYGAQSTNFNTMIVTRISAMSVAWSTLLTDIKEVHRCRITANAVGYEVHRCASNGVTDQLQTSKNSRARRTNMREQRV